MASTSIGGGPAPSAQALAGVRVVEMGQLIAGPFAGKTLGDFGAEIIKIESPEGGDPLRQWRLLKEGTSLWWQVQSRNKQSVALDVRTPEGQEIARRLIGECDVLIENFRPGTMEGWGLGWNALQQINPGLIMLRISGYGQTGPYRDRPSFGSIGEAMGGLRHLTGLPGQIPVRCGISIGDTLAALHGTIGVLLALHHREANGGAGQVIDVALHESVFNTMESMLPEYSALGEVRAPAGSALPGIAPSNAYRCRDGLVLIAGNGDSIFTRLMNVIGREDLGGRADLANNQGRVRAVVEIDHAIEEWTGPRTVEEVLAELDRDLVGLAPVKNRIRDIAALLVIDKLRTNLGLVSEAPSLHMNFVGNPGTGKTSVAMRMAQILHRLGYVRKGHLVAVTRDDLVGQYIGHTAPKTKEVLKKAMGGVLFIDEAYYLYRPENERDYGQEAIEILLQVMENQRDDLVVILAGYKDRMDTFFESNPGMSSRVAHHLDFPDYSVDELVQISQKMLVQQNYVFAPDADAVFQRYLGLRVQQPHFANARSVRNALDRARLRQASRLFADRDRKLTADDLRTLTASDFAASRVFQQAGVHPDE